MAHEGVLEHPLGRDGDRRHVGGGQVQQQVAGGHEHAAGHGQRHLRRSAGDHHAGLEGHIEPVAVGVTEIRRQPHEVLRPRREGALQHQRAVSDPDPEVRHRRFHHDGRQHQRVLLLSRGQRPREGHLDPRAKFIAPRGLLVRHVAEGQRRISFDPSGPVGRESAIGGRVGGGGRQAHGQPDLERAGRDRGGEGHLLGVADERAVQGGGPLPERPTADVLDLHHLHAAGHGAEDAGRQRRLDPGHDDLEVLLQILRVHRVGEDELQHRRIGVAGPKQGVAGREAGRGETQRAGQGAVLGQRLPESGDEVVGRLDHIAMPRRERLIGQERQLLAADPGPPAGRPRLDGERLDGHRLADGRLGHHRAVEAQQHAIGIRRRGVILGMKADELQRSGGGGGGGGGGGFRASQHARPIRVGCRRRTPPGGGLSRDEHQSDDVDDREDRREREESPREQPHAHLRVPVAGVWLSCPGPVPDVASEDNTTLR